MTPHDIPVPRGRTRFGQHQESRPLDRWHHRSSKRNVRVCMENCTGPRMIPGPQMIPDRKWSPNWTANDPGPEMITDRDRKWSRLKNKEWRAWWDGVDYELAYVNTDYNYNGLQVAFFFIIQWNFVANYDVTKITTQSSKHDLACISLQFSVKLWSVHTLHILFC